MTNPGPTSETLYCGPDLGNAASRSVAGSPIGGRFAGATNAVGILGDLLRHRFVAPRGQRLQIATVRGIPLAGGEPFTAVYAGNGVNKQWCLSTVFARHEECHVTSPASVAEAEDHIAELADSANITFTDGLTINGHSAGDRAFIRMPAWVKLRLAVQPHWSTQLESMRRGTRQEAARMLRKYRYSCRLTTHFDDTQHFYGELYEPYVRSRFGAGVIVVEPDRFFAECRRGVLLQLLHEKSVIAGTVLRRIGNTMAVVWSALDTQVRTTEMRGVTDTMDYFSLLYAHLKGCRWLDFGPSRPDLYDGTLRYKAKWGARITTGIVPQAPVCVTCSGRDTREFRFLMRHAFLVKFGKSLTAMLFIDGSMDAGKLRQMLRGLPAPGISAYRLIALPAAGDELRAVAAEYGSNLVLRDAASINEALAAAIR